MPPVRVARLVPLALGLLLVAACGRAPAALAPPPPAGAVEVASTVEATPAPGPSAAAPVTPRPARVVIAAVGDLMLDRDVEGAMEAQGPLYPFERALPLLEGASVRLGNLEGTFTERGVARDKQYTFRTAPALAEGLALAGFDAVSLANNHTLDFGAVGLADTLSALDAVGVGHAGAGASAPEAYAPLLLDAGSATVAVLSFNGIPGSWPAEAATPGVAWVDARALEAIAAADAAADFVVVMVHWGVEYDSTPGPDQQAFGRAAIDAGADVVVGHHPHALQPWERYRGGVILYSLGNFVFDLDPDDLATLGTRPFATAVALLTLEEGAPVAVEVRPAYIDPAESRPRPASPAEEAVVRGALYEGTP